MNFDLDFKDGLVLAALLAAYCPYLVRSGGSFTLLSCGLFSYFEIYLWVLVNSVRCTVRNSQLNLVHSGTCFSLGARFFCKYDALSFWFGE